MKRKLEYQKASNRNNAKFAKLNGKIYPIVSIDSCSVVLRTGFDRENVIRDDDFELFGVELLEYSIEPEFEMIGVVVAFDIDCLVIKVEQPQLCDSNLRLGDELKLTVEIQYEPVTKAY